MRTPLKRAELVAKWGKYRFTILCSLLMLLMMFFGYQLAVYNQVSLQKQLASEQLTRAVLEQENTTLRQRVSELEVNSMLNGTKATVLNKTMEDYQTKIGELEQQLSFYQRVMAPEVTQDGFFIDGTQVQVTASDRVYRLSAILLQQNNNKGLITGKLNITIEGSLDGKPYLLKPGSPDYFPDGAIKRGDYTKSVRWEELRSVASAEPGPGE